MIYKWKKKTGVISYFCCLEVPGMISTIIHSQAKVSTVLHRAALVPQNFFDQSVLIFLNTVVALVYDKDFGKPLET